MLALGVVQTAAAADVRPDQARFHAIYKELVETNTTLSSGSCTLAAERMGARLKSAGFKDSEITYFAVPEHPKDGGLVAILPGSSKTAKPMLLLGHLDVVEAKREDWTRDPFVLIEEDGYFYGRGTADMKALDAIWVDMLMRFKEQGYQPKRTIKLALTCGEETIKAFNGADWLAKNKRDLIDAEFALNEGGGGRADANGKLQTQGVQVGEKVVQQFRVETTNPGGHSSVPVRDNAIYELSEALLKVRDYEFPMQLSDTTRTFLAKAGAGRTGRAGHGHGRPRQGPDGQGRRGRAQQGPRLPQRPAHHLCGDPAGRRPRGERPAAARRRQHQLPHVPRPHHGRDPPGAGDGHRRPEGEADGPAGRSAPRPCRRRSTRRSWAPPRRSRPNTSPAFR